MTKSKFLSFENCFIESVHIYRRGRKCSQVFLKKISKLSEPTNEIFWPKRKYPNFSKGSFLGVLRTDINLYSKLALSILSTQKSLTLKWPFANFSQLFFVKIGQIGEITHKLESVKISHNLNLKWPLAPSGLVQKKKSQQPQVRITIIYKRIKLVFRFKDFNFPPFLSYFLPQISFVGI